MEEENVKYDSRDSLRRHYEEDTKTSELRFEGFNGGNSGIAVTDGEEDLERNEISVKASSRVFSGVGSIAARYKSMSPARLPISRSPCLTIPPGFSPTSLLDSPVLLSNMKPEPSPTTGTFSKPQMMHVSVVSSDNTCDERRSGDFEFKPHIRSALDSGISSLAPSVSTGLNQQQSDSFIQVQGQCHQSFASPLSVKCENITASSHELTLSVTAPNLPVHMVASRASVPAEVATDDLHQRPGLDGGIQASQSEHNGTSPSVIAEKSSEDGYNWRKYGQKHVKGSEFPRSYYKCTHPNCEVKKLLERSHVGQIKEIIYKGRHDHPKPQPNRRLAVGTILSIQEERPENLSALTSTGDKSSNGHGQTSHYIDPNGTPELSPVTASDDDVEGAVTRSNRFIDGIDDDDDPESKRRKKDISGVDVTPLGKPTREPRVVVQTLSEVDILDDGYRWRKYGQKVVKGNPNPRSYYKCTNAGCPVRKHVERASHDPKAVITTYEGKHNHDVPAARTSSHDIAGNATTLNSMSRTRSDENDTISLDLGVGISSSPENRSNDKQQTPDTETDQSQTHIATHSQGNVIQATPISTHYASLNDGIDRHGSREDRVESFSFKNPSLNHSSNSFQQNMGSLLMGP